MSNRCKDCKHDKGRCVGSARRGSHQYCFEPKVITNADRLRAMSDEKLAAWARRQIGCGSDYFPCGIVCDGKCNSFDDETCQAKIMDYLKQPVKGN